MSRREAYLVVAALLLLTAGFIQHAISLYL